MAHHIRNFSIIAHIDHGKSTLADRLLQHTHAVSDREARAQLLDSMDLERERGITIKASAVTVLHHHVPGACADTDEGGGAGGGGGDGVGGGGQTYMLNFIDTPGHVDFTYEVSRALTACEGALLVVDATQGVQAQTVVNAYLAIEQDLEMIPVINKIDLPGARPEDVAMEIEQVLGLAAEDCIMVSAKTGKGVPELLAAICEKLPGPKPPTTDRTRALIFDSVYDDYRGVVTYLRVFDGSLAVGDKVRMMGLGRTYQVTDLGKYTPKATRVKTLAAGETGYMVAAIRNLSDVRVGDTITLDRAPADEALPGYESPHQMVFCDFYPATTADKGGDFEALREAIEKLSLNDASFTYQAVHSDALGFGFRCGFLGLLHMDIIQQRLEREGGVEVVQTAPTVSYQVKLRGSIEHFKTRSGEKVETGAGGSRAGGSRGGGGRGGGGGEERVIEVHNPADLPDAGSIEQIREPMCRVEIMLPKSSIGDVMKLCLDRRGTYKSQTYVSEARDMLTFEVPLAEIIYDFYDKLKGMTAGYGTMDYEITHYHADNLCKVDILVNGESVEALSMIVHRESAEKRGRLLIQKLRRQIPRHQFEIPLQATIGGKIIARETIKAYRKNVTAKCYGGDVTRKRKLLEAQKKGKAKMKSVGSVNIPQEAFMAVLETGES